MDMYVRMYLHAYIESGPACLSLYIYKHTGTSNRLAYTYIQEQATGWHTRTYRNKQQVGMYVHTMPEDMLLNYNELCNSKQELHTKDKPQREPKRNITSYNISLSGQMEKYVYSRKECQNAKDNRKTAPSFQQPKAQTVDLEKSCHHADSSYTIDKIMHSRQLYLKAAHFHRCSFQPTICTPKKSRLTKICYKYCNISCMMITN